VTHLSWHNDRLRTPGQGDHAEKRRRPESAAKFREETSKKADSAVRDRIAAMHNVGDRLFARKRFFAMQHRTPQIFFWGRCQPLAGRGL
jgi:hypothetical protein